MLRKPHWLIALVGLLLGGLVVGSPLGAYYAAGAGPGTPGTGGQPAATGDWPMFGHDSARTNYNPDETLLNAGNVGQLVQRWQANIGGNGTAFSAPIVSNGRVYVESSVSTGNNLRGYDAISGTSVMSSSVG